MGSSLATALRGAIAPRTAGGSRGGLTAFGFVVIFLAATWPVARGSVYPKWDASSFYAPAYALVADFARSGRLLSWNPWTNGGSPDFADPQYGAFSPLVTGFGLLFGPTLTGFEWYWLTSWLLGGLGMLVLARSLGAPSWGSLVVALGFVCSGFFSGHAEHTTFIHGYAALPWAIWRLDAALKRDSILTSAQAGALWAVSGLAAYPGIVALNAGTLVAWSLGRALFCAREFGSLGSPSGMVVARRSRNALWGRLWRTLRVGLVALVVGGVIIAPTYVGLLVDGAGFSDRSGPLPKDVAVRSNALAPGALSTLATPALAVLKLTDPKHLWPGTDPSSTSVYMGAILLWLALCALLLRPRSAWRWWLGGLALGALLLAVGGALPFRAWAYDLLPPLRYFRHSAIFRGYTMFFAAVLAALGTRDLAVLIANATRTSPLRFVGCWRGMAVLGYALAALAVMAFGWVAMTVSHLPGKGGDAFRSALWAGSIHVLLIWGLVVVLATMMILPGSRRWAVALPAMLAVAATLDGVASARLSAPLMWTQASTVARLWSTLERKHNARVDVVGTGLSRTKTSPLGIGDQNNYNLFLKEPVLYGYTPFQNRFHQRWRSPCSGGVLVAAATGENRTWFAPVASVATIELSNKAFSAFCARAARLGAPPMVLHSGTSMLTGTHGGRLGVEAAVVAIARLPAAQRLAVRTERYGPDLLEIAVEVPSNGYVLVTDRWARHWRVWVNGRPQELLGGMFIFRAVAVRRGHNVLRFEFHATGEPYLVGLSWAMLFGIGLLSLRRQWTKGNG